jgi:hypothetical protein
MATSKVCVGESSCRRRSASLGIIISICHSLPFLLLAVLHVPVEVRSRYSATAALTVVVARTALRAGNGFGSCCSSSGYYRNTTTFFSAGCQASFGTSSTGSTTMSTHGSCEGSKGLIRTGSEFGDCCSSSGYCGSTGGHYTTACHSTFGKCTTSSTNPGGVSLDGSCEGANKYSKLLWLDDEKGLETLTDY